MSALDGPRPIPGESIVASIALSRWLLAAGMIYRCVGAPGSIIGFLGVATPLRQEVQWVLGALVGLVVLNGVGAVLILRVHATWILERRSLFAADLAVAFAINLTLAAVLAPGSVNREAYDVAWFYLIGATATWTAVRGPEAGAAVVLLGVPLQLGMTMVNGGSPVEQPLGKLLVRESWMAVGFALSFIAVLLYRHGRRLARHEGLLLGRATERARRMREMHDTALQTLEAIALIAGDQRTPPAERLSDVRDAARRQAVELRATLLTDEGGQRSPVSVVRLLRQQAATVNANGLSARVVVSEELTASPDSALVPADTAHALRQAVGEALSNVAKHSGAATATVQIRRVEERLHVHVVDHGCGFAPDCSLGFGLQQSIEARMLEVGGTALVRSHPGRGTAVVLSVPLAHGT